MSADAIKKLMEIRRGPFNAMQCNSMKKNAAQ